MQRTLALLEDKKRMVQIEPMCNPPEVAQFETKLCYITQRQFFPGEVSEVEKEKLNPRNIEGHWDWKNDGEAKTGELVLKKDGAVELQTGDQKSDGNWEFVPDGTGDVRLIFDDIVYTMIPDSEGKNFVQMYPLKFPPSVASFVKAIEKEADGYWTEHCDIDI